MTIPTTIRVRRADGTEVDLPAETRVYVRLEANGPSLFALGLAYKTGVPRVWFGYPTDERLSFVDVELPAERAARLERELEAARSAANEALAALRDAKANWPRNGIHGRLLPQTSASLRRAEEALDRCEEIRYMSASVLNLDELETRAHAAKSRADVATPGPWKTWVMSVMADIDGTSNVDTAVLVADTHCNDEHGGPRTFNADFIAAARSDVPDLADTVLKLAAEIRHLRPSPPDTVRLFMDDGAVRDVPADLRCSAPDEPIDGITAKVRLVRGKKVVTCHGLARVESWRELAERERAGRLEAERQLAGALRELRRANTIAPAVEPTQASDEHDETLADTAFTCDAREELRRAAWTGQLGAEHHRAAEMLADELDSTGATCAAAVMRRLWSMAFAARPEQGRARGGIYIASKSAHGPRWQALRADGFPICSTWIDESAEGATADWADLWNRCIAEASGADVMIVYVEPGEVHKGSLVDLGAALHAGVPVLWVGPEYSTAPRHRLVRRVETMAEALRLAGAMGLTEKEGP